MGRPRKPDSSPRRFWTRAEDAELRKLFPHQQSAEVAKLLGISLLRVQARAHRLGLHKTAEFMASPAACRLRRGDNVGKQFRYPKGHVPANKGLRRPGYNRGRMRETQFTKGQVSHNWKPIGTTYFDSDGYLRRKIANGIGGSGNTKVWAFEHVRVWEAVNGPIPTGHCLAFKDKNKANCELDNLELITRAERMRRNTIHNLPHGLRQVIQLNAVLKRTIRKRGNANGEEHDRRPQGSSICDARVS